MGKRPREELQWPVLLEETEKKKNLGGPESQEDDENDQPLLVRHISRGRRRRLDYVEDIKEKDDVVTPPLQLIPPLQRQLNIGAIASLLVAEWIGNVLIGQEGKDTQIKQQYQLQQQLPIIELIQVLGAMIRAGAAEPRHASLIAHQLRSPQSSTRLEAVRAISSFPLALSRPYLSDIAEDLHDVCEKVRTMTLGALGGEGGSQLVKHAGPYIPQILASLEDLSASVRKTASTAIGNLGGHGLITRQHIEVMTSKVKSRSPQIREAVLLALVRLPGETLMGIQGMIASLLLREPAWSVRTLALEILGRFSDTKAWEEYLPLVVQRLGDSRMEVQQAALALLRKVDPDVLRPFVHDLLGFARAGGHSNSSNGTGPLGAAPASSAAITGAGGSQVSSALSALALLPCTAVEPFAVELATDLLPRLSTSSNLADRMIELLGRMRTEILLPLLGPILGDLFHRLDKPWSIDALIAKQIATTIGLIRNREIRRECTSRLITETSSASNRPPHYRIRALRVIAELGQSVIDCHQVAFIACLQEKAGPASPRVRHEAFTIILSHLTPSALQDHASILARTLIGLNDRWLGAALKELESASSASADSSGGSISSTSVAIIRAELMRLLDSDNVEERQGAMKVMGRIPHEDVLLPNLHITKEGEREKEAKGVQDDEEVKDKSDVEDAVASASAIKPRKLEVDLIQTEQDDKGKETQKQ